MKESEVKARLAQAEAHFSHYRWDDAIAIFEAILAGAPDHPLATQGWARAVEQKSLDEELREALAKARGSLAAQRFDEALSLLNHAQTRGALSHILKYHSEIDGLRSEAQEGQEWTRRIQAATREADALAGRRRFDQALESLDDTLRGLRARGWERLGAELVALREKLWAERDVSERVQFAQAAYEREDFALAAELADALREELPGREDVRRLRERSRAAWKGVQERLAAVNAALGEGRTEDALALLANLRIEHPRNPDWQAVALRVYMDDGRAEFAKGRGLLGQEAYEDAAEAFDAARAAFATVAEIFPEHPTARHEQAEATALREVALAASQGARDREAFRWEASRQSWHAARKHLDAGIAARGRELGEVATIVNAALREVEAAVGDIEHARLMLADGRQALDARDAAAGREAFRAGLSRVEGGRLGESGHLNELRDGLAAGLREAERIQRDVKKLLGQAEAAGDASQRLALLRRAYERWETAPGLATRLAEELLAAAQENAQAGSEDDARALCDEIAGLTGAPAGALSDAARLAADITRRRAEAAAQAEAAEHAAQAESVEAALRPVEQALLKVDEACAPVADGEMDAVDWAAADASLKAARKALRAARSALQPAPPRWEELKARVEALERRNALLRDLSERMAHGRGIDALPALQAYAAENADPLAQAALESLLREGSEDALTAARSLLAQAAAALERGELATAESYAALAQHYAPAAPRVVPELRRAERQIALLTEARRRTREARALAATGDRSSAFLAFQAALELVADGESGLPPQARHELLRALDAADSANEEREGSGLLADAGHPLVREFVAPALGWWRRLAQQRANLAREETESARLRRKLLRARRLAEQAAYADALAEIEPAIFASAVSSQSDVIEEIADEADELRRMLAKLLKASEQLAPVVERMRAAALAGQFDEALALRDQAGWLDPAPDGSALWAELDELAARIKQRRSPPRAVAPPYQADEARSVAPRQPEAAALAGTLPQGARHSPPIPPDERREPQAGAEPIIAAHESSTAAAAGPMFAAASRETVARPPEKPSSPQQPTAVISPPEPVEPPAPFDLDDWLSNVTELGPDERPGNES